MHDKGDYMARECMFPTVCEGSISCIGICIEGVEDTTTAATLGVGESHIGGDLLSKNPME
jgi:hypothetical protein